MATYYGEILPLSSRAVDDEEDTNIPIDEIELIESSNVEIRIKEPEFLFFAVGPSACIFAEAYLLGLTGNADSLPVMMVKKRQSETSVDDVPFSGLDYRRKDDVLAKVFRTSRNPKAIVCLCPGLLEPENAARLTQLMFRSLNCSTLKTVASLSSAHITEFKTSDPVGSLRTPLLRHLSTSSPTLSQENLPSGVSQWLEQPNILSGIAAAALTECEIQNVPGVSCVCYVDSSDSTTARAFEPFLKCWPFKDTATSSTDSAAQSIDRLILEKLKDHGNLYI